MLVVDMYFKNINLGFLLYEKLFYDYYGNVVFYFLDFLYL